MSQETTTETRNTYLDQYTMNHEAETLFQKTRAKPFIKKQYDLLIKAGFKPRQAGDRLKLDLLDLWSDKTIREYLPYAAKHTEMIRDKSKPYYEEEHHHDEQETNDSPTDSEMENEFEDKYAEAQANPTETLPPVTRRCPSCNIVIAIRENYQLSIYQ